MCTPTSFSALAVCGRLLVSPAAQGNVFRVVQHLFQFCLSIHSNHVICTFQKKQVGSLRRADEEAWAQAHLETAGEDAKKGRQGRNKRHKSHITPGIRVFYSSEICFNMFFFQNTTGKI